MLPWAAISAGTGLVSLLGGLLSSGKSPQEQSYEQIMKMIKESGMSETPYSKQEIEALVKDMQTMYRGAGSLAATKVGSAIGESDAAGGQGWADYYMSNIAPILAQGEMGAAEAGKFGVSAYSNMFDSAKNRTLQSLGLMTQASAGLPSMTGMQKGTAGFLQTLNLLAGAGGNIASAYANFNRKYPTTDAQGNVAWQ